MLLSDSPVVLATIALLVILEALLSADNALVLAVLVRHLPDRQRTKSLRYGMVGAFVFRLIAVVFAAYLLDWWVFKLVGGGYLLYLAAKELLKAEETEAERQAKDASFWWTVAAVELTDIAFSIDSILAAVAMAEGMPKRLHEAMIGPLSVKTWTVYVGGILGIVAMRFVAGYFLRLLERFPAMGRSAYYLVAWIGLKLLGSGIHAALHPRVQAIDTWRDHVPPSLMSLPTEMHEALFWGGMLVLFATGFVTRPSSRPLEPDENTFGPHFQA